MNSNSPLTPLLRREGNQDVTLYKCEMWEKMSRFKLVLVVVVLLSFYQVSLSNDSLDIKPKVVFLTQDVADGYDHAGCTPDLLRILKDSFNKIHPEMYVNYDLKRLMKNGVGPYYIFNKKYCDKIGKILGANIFVMSRLVLVGHDEKGECEGDLYDVQVKVYSKINEKETMILKLSKVPVYKFDELFQGKEKEYIKKILGAGSS